MFEFLLKEIKREVYKEKLKSWKDLTVFEKCSLVLLLIFSILFLVGSIQKWKTSSVFYILLIILVGVIYRYSTQKEKRQHEKLKNEYLLHNIFTLKKILRKHEWNMYNLEGIGTLKAICRARVEKANEPSWISKYIIRVFTIIVIPTVMLGLGAALNDKEIDVIMGVLGGFLSVTFLIVIIIFFCIILGEIPFQNKKSFYESLIEDLEYLEIMYVNAERGGINDTNQENY